MEKMEESCALCRLRGWKVLGILEDNQYRDAAGEMRAFLI